MLIWNGLLTLGLGTLLFMQFKPSGKSRATPVNSGNDSVTKSFKIAYFEMDSVEAHFDMVKTVKDEIGAKNNELEKNVGDLDGKYKSKYESLASKTYTTQEEQEKAQEELRQYAETLKLQKDDFEQKYQDFVMRKNLAVKTRIEDFLKKFNSDSRYSYIISYEIGLFYFRDTTYNITNQLIKGLNEDYRNNKPAPEKK
ncbi:MAG TPA: OmpH family outer membrane protein [Chitinophagaceae bacterium]|nr:OmpH family outer membrane protein [Chitinophagaceae bacterium]